jgi:hypothetical protein
MARPILALKPKRPPNADPCPECEGWYAYNIQTDRELCVKCGRGKEDAPQEQLYPKGWNKGELLNVRRSGDNFMLTRLNEEFDHNHPENALVFSSSYECQEFISGWYARDAIDPRAI